MNPWVPIISFAIAVFFLGLWLQVAQQKFHPLAMVEWVIIGLLALVGVSIWHQMSHARPVTMQSVMNQMNQSMPDACKDGNGQPVSNNPGCPGYVRPSIPEIDASTFGSHPDLGSVPTLTPRQRGTR